MVTVTLRNSPGANGTLVGGAGAAIHPSGMPATDRLKWSSSGPWLTTTTAVVAGWPGVTASCVTST